MRLHSPANFAPVRGKFRAVVSKISLTISVGNSTDLIESAVDKVGQASERLRAIIFEYRRKK